MKGNKKGAVLLIVALAMVFLLGVTALVTDIGMAYARQRHLSNALDAAALAGARDIVISSTQAEETADYYLGLNNIDTDVVQVDINASQSEGKIVLKGTRSVPLYFARVFGKKTLDVSASVTAIIGKLSGIRGLKPFGLYIEEEYIEDYENDYSGTIEAGKEFGDIVQIKSATSDHGNFGTVNFSKSYDDTENKTLLEIAKEGYSGLVSIGDPVYTKPGASENLYGPNDKTLSSYIESVEAEDESFWTNPENMYTLDPDNPRVWFVPIFYAVPTEETYPELTKQELAALVDSLIEEWGTKWGLELTKDNTGAYELPVVAFAAIYVEELVPKQQTEPRVKSTVVKARFMRAFIPDGEISQPGIDGSTLGVKLYK